MEQWLPIVDKPSRYIGNELNAIQKDHATVDLTFALAYPDFYEIGMSNTGLNILYHLLNERSELACERVYLPGRDLEALLFEHGEPLTSLETRTEIRRFDIFGIQIPHELAYANIVKLLRLSQIPIYAASRKDTDPFVIGGGPGAFAPEPVAPFYDGILLGDGEEAVLELTRIVREGRAEGAGRATILERLTAVDGMYVPSLFDLESDPLGRISRIVPKKAGYERVTKALVEDLETAFYPDTAIVPYTNIVHDRVGVEVMRGCTVGCRFCQAGMIYRPLRERLPKTILKLAENSLCKTGFDSVSLLSLDTGDYTLIDPLTREIIDRTLPKRVSVSLPSLRAGSLTDETIGEIRKVRKTSFTIAPEAGTQRLRDVINKNISNEEIFETVERVVRQGWTSIKFYFMIGFPTETDDDLDGLVDLVRRCRKIARRVVKGFNITVSFGTLVPKPHTPFQWDEQISVAEARRRAGRLARSLRSLNIAYRIHEPESSWLEGVFSRGDRRLAPAIVAAERRGGGFESWQEHINLGLWREVFAEHGIDADSYLRRRSYDEVLPWDHLDCMVSKPYLLADRRKVDREKTTFDCRDDLCAGCSACFDEDSDVRNRLAKYADDPFGDGRPLPMALTQRVAGGHDFGLKLEKARDQSAKAGDDAAAAILRRRRRPADPSNRRWAVTPGAPGQAGPATAFASDRIIAEQTASTEARDAAEALEASTSATAAPETAAAEPATLETTLETTPETAPQPTRAADDELSPEKRLPEVSRSAPENQKQYRYRVHYTRTGRLRFLSNLEVLRLLYRVVQRSDIPIFYSRGFRPRPKIDFGPPIPVGSESECEAMDLYLIEDREPEDLLATVREGFPVEAGLEPIKVERLDFHAPSIQRAMIEQNWRVPVDSIYGASYTRDELERRLRAFEDAERVLIHQVRGRRTRVVDLKALVKRVLLEDGAPGSGPMLRMLIDTSGTTAKPAEIVASILDIELDTARTARYLKRDPAEPWPIAV